MIQSFYTNQFISSACFLTLCFHTCGCVSKTLQEMRTLSRSLSDCYITKLLLMSLSLSLSLSSVYDNSAVRWRCWNQNVTDSLQGWAGIPVPVQVSLTRSTIELPWTAKKTSLNIQRKDIWKCFQCVHIGSSLPEVECLDNLSSLTCSYQSLLWLFLFVHQPCEVKNCQWWHLSNVTKVKRQSCSDGKDKKFNYKTLKAKEIVIAWSKESFLKLIFTKYPFHLHSGGVTAQHDEKIINQQDLNIFKGKDGSLMHLHQ